MKDLIQYEELLLRYNGNKKSIPYYELLETEEWFHKRKNIIKRDNYKCSICDSFEYLNWDKQLDGTYKYYCINWGEGEDMPFEWHYSDRKVWLHVHHKFYIEDKLPWEYDDKDLMTYCNWCHYDFHEKNVIKFYKQEVDNNLTEVTYIPCKRCHGAGCFPQYRHVENGIFFELKAIGRQVLIRIIYEFHKFS
jgi:5-methylcytosine-specific restriction endonuclease McrA